MNLYMGAKIPLTPYVFTDRNGWDRKTFMGEVVYINRKHRYFVARFDFPYGSFREAFKFFEKETEKPKPNTRIWKARGA